MKTSDLEHVVYYANYVVLDDLQDAHGASFIKPKIFCQRKKSAGQG